MGCRTLLSSRSHLQRRRTASALIPHMVSIFRTITMLVHSIDTSMCKQFVGFICMLLGLIENQDWETFEKLALSDKYEFQCLSENVSVCAEFNGA